jgi:hypothetical protein
MNRRGSMQENSRSPLCLQGLKSLPSTWKRFGLAVMNRIYLTFLYIDGDSLVPRS